MSAGPSSAENVTDVKSTWEEIKKAVDDVIPTMVFSVIGDSDSFVPHPWPRTVFQTALIEAAKDGGDTWIVYGGSELQVSRAVRDAYLNYENREFGERDDNIPQNHHGRHIKLICFKEVDDQHKDTKTEKGFQEIVVHCSGRINKSMLEFEKFVAEQKVSIFKQKQRFRMPVPIAILVCEGDIETVSHTADALQNKLPVIIMKGSGKAADLIVDYLERSGQLRKKAGVLFGIKFEDRIFNKLKQKLKIIRKNRDFLEIFDLNFDDPLTLSDIVGQTVVSCWSLENMSISYTKDDTKQFTGEQIEVKIIVGKPYEATQSLERPRKRKNICAEPYVDIMNIRGSSITSHRLGKKSVILEQKAVQDFLERFKNKSRFEAWNSKYTSPTSLPLYFYFGYQILQESNQWKKSGHILLLEALRENRCDYVRVLLDQEVNLKTKDLRELYCQTVSCKDCDFEKEDCFHMQWILKHIGEKEATTMCHRMTTDEKVKEENAADAAKKLCLTILRYEGFKKTNCCAAQGSAIDNRNEENKEGCQDVCDISDILLWAIFANRKEIAEICWIRGENHIWSGLVCSVLLRKLSKKAQNVKNQGLSMDLADHGKLFEQRCINILDRMYIEEPKHAVKVMDEDANIWGIQSNPLAIASDNFMYDIVAHTCSRKNMNEAWYNHLAPDVKLFLKSAWKEPKKFFTAPFTRYIFNYVMFFSMLVMYSAFVLTSVNTGYQQGTGKIFEYYVYFWATGDFIQELISCFGCSGQQSRFNRGYYRRLKRHLYDFWNAVDLLSYILLIIALFVRHFHQSENFTVARRLFSLSLLVMYLRFLEVFLVHRTLGPTLIMIKEMLKDLFSFLFIAVFVILGVGIYYHANLFPDYQFFWSGHWTDWRIWDVIYYPYWQIYAELNLDFLNAEEQPDTSGTGTHEPSPHKDWSVVAIAAAYLLFAHLLLVNLVIAMFSYTFERVQQISEKLWWYERNTAISDYKWRLPSPFNLILLPFTIKNQMGKKTCSTAIDDSKQLKCDRERNYRKHLQKIIALSIYNKI